MFESAPPSGRARTPSNAPPEATVRMTQTGSVLFYYNDDVELWDAIEKAREQETAVTLATALRMFESHANGHILVKINYGAQAPDCVLSYQRLEDKVEDPKGKKKNTFDPELEAKKARYRQRYERLLLEKGFILEKGYGMVPEERFIKVYAPFAILCIEAQEIGLRMRLKEETKPRKTSWIRNVIYGEETPKYSSAPFDFDRLQEFSGSDVGHPPTSSEQVINFNENFFSSAHRTLLVDSVMSHLKISKNWKEKQTQNEKLASTLMGDLLKRQVYTKWFFLHDGDYEQKDGSVRALLYKNWVWSPLSYQPLDMIRGYFGEKIALYFAWLGYYTYWLTLAAVVGTGVFIYGVIRAQRKEGDLLSNFEVIFDNELSAPFALFMSVWATLFLEYWKRRNARLQVAWDVYDFEAKEQPRPGYIATIERVSPITGEKEFVYPHFHRMVKLVISTIIVLISIGIVLVIVGIIIVARPLIRNSFDASSAAPQVITAVLSLVLVMVASNLYVGAAGWLTDWENHRTSTGYEDALILKRFLFEFVNYYSSLFYIALIKKWAGKKLLNDPKLTDLCGFDGSCLSDLMVQLAIIFVGKQLVGQLVEIGIPIAKNIFRKRTRVKAKQDRAAHFSSESIDKKTPQYVEDEILPEFTSVFDEYNEMVIQFGFCTLFVAAFPLAPLFAFLNNLTEIRTDAYKLITQTQRPPALRAQDIGSWETILTLISHISVPINAFIIAFSSKSTKELLANWFGSDPSAPGEPNLASQLAFVVVFEHIVFLLKLLFAFLVPDVPADAVMVQSRNEWLYEQYRQSLIPGKLNTARKIEQQEMAVVDDKD